MLRAHAFAVVVSTAVAATTACGGGGPAEFGAAEASAIRQLAQDLQDAYNARDADKVVSYFAGASVLMPPNSSTVRGQDSIRGYFTVRFAEGGTGLKVEVADIGGEGPLAYLAGTYDVSTVPEAGPEIRDRGKFLWIVRGQGGTWRFIYQTWSSDLPPRPPPPPAEPTATEPGANPKTP